MSKYAKPNFASMSGPELVRNYNEMVLTAVDLEIPAKEVVRFSDTAAGIRRCEALHANIQGALEELRAEKKKAESSASMEELLNSNMAAIGKELTRVSKPKGKRRKGPFVDDAPPSPNDAKKIHVNQKYAAPDKNPHRGLAGKRFALLRSGMTVGAYGDALKKAGLGGMRRARRDMNWWSQDGQLKLEG